MTKTINECIYGLKKGIIDAGLSSAATCTERINTRILNDYHLHQMMIRNDSKQMFFAIFACINIHLDAWAKDELKS
jgi:hypothetical protein